MEYIINYKKWSALFEQTQATAVKKPAVSVAQTEAKPSAQATAQPAVKKPTGTSVDSQAKSKTEPTTQAEPAKEFVKGTGIQIISGNVYSSDKYPKQAIVEINEDGDITFYKYTPGSDGGTQSIEISNALPTVSWKYSKADGSHKETVLFSGGAMTSEASFTILRNISNMFFGRLDGLRIGHVVSSLDQASVTHQDKIKSNTKLVGLLKILADSKKLSKADFIAKNSSIPNINDIAIALFGAS